MIALNQLISNKEKFTEKYKLMHKHFDIEKIIRLEQKFIVLDKQNQDNRAKCNNLCGQVAELINSKKPTDELISQINILDKKINKTEITTKKYYQKLCKMLKKLPNLPLEDNEFDVTIKSNRDENYSANDFISFATALAKPKETTNSIKNYFKANQNIIYNDTLPFSIKTKNKICLMLCENATEIFNQLSSELQAHAELFIKKSIKKLEKFSAISYQAKFFNQSQISIDFVGEYLSRGFMLKYKTANAEITHFVNMILIKF